MGYAKPGTNGMTGALPADLLRPVLLALQSRDAASFAALDSLYPDGLPAGVVAGHSGSVERPVFAQLYGRGAVALAAAISGDPQEAQDYAARVEFMLTVLLSSMTLRDAVANMTRFNAMMGDHGVMITAVPDNGFDRIVIDLDTSLPGAPVCLWTVCILFVLNMLSWLRGDRLAVEEIGLACAADTPLDPCLAYLGLPVRAVQPVWSIRLASGTLDAPVAAQSLHRADDLQLLCHDPAYWHETGVSFPGQIDQAFTRLAEASGRCPDRLALCHDLGISPSTLHRRLQGEGASFQQVKVAWQHRTALAMIGRGEAVAAVARYLGFADARSFRRAFVEWTGQTPSACRAGLSAA